MALTKSERTIVCEAIELIQRETANNGDKITVRGFGTFKRKEAPARTARNPQTGEAIQVPARSVLKFSATKGAK